MFLAKSLKGALLPYNRYHVASSSSTIYPIFSCSLMGKEQWNRNVATAVRTKTRSKDLKDDDSSSPKIPSSTIVTTSPSISTLFHDVDKMFDRNPFFFPSPNRTHDDLMSHFWKQMDWMDTSMRTRRCFSNSYFPNYDINSDEDKVQVVLDVPGVNLRDIDVTVENDTFLNITGHRTTKSDDGTTTSELNFDKRFNFGENVIDSSKIVANLANGVLQVSLPKLPPSAKSVPENVKNIDVIDGSDDLEC